MPAPDGPTSATVSAPRVSAARRSNDSPSEGDVDVEDVHALLSSLEVSRIAALTIISSTLIEIAWSRLASNSE